ncbi:MAG: carboxypeptidase-like regulatory domain-containing protein [Actinobacteria bacterium]|nr:carboxypeptidase-like regulatory domain-containing protein [Actinomycetota bacterium]
MCPWNWNGGNGNLWGRLPRGKAPFQIYLLIASALLAGILLVSSLSGANGPSESATFGSSASFDGGGVRSDGYHEPAAPGTSAQTGATAISPILPGRDNQFSDTPAAQLIDGGGITVPDPPGDNDPDITVWQDRADDGFIAGNGSGPITGRVTDPWGNGIPGVSVYTDIVPCYSRGCSQFEPAAYTDSSGYYSIQHVSYEYDDSGWNALAADSFVPKTFSDPSDLTGSHTVYFSGQIGGSFANEWYNNARWTYPGGPLGSQLVPAGSSSVDAVLIPSTNLNGELIGAQSPEMSIYVYRADRPELVSSLYTSYLPSGNLGFSNYMPAGDYKLLAAQQQTWNTLGSWQNGPLSSWFQLSRSWETARAIHIEPDCSYSVRFRLVEPSALDDATIRGNLVYDYWYGSDAVPQQGTLVSLVDAGNPAHVIATRPVSPTNFTFEFAGVAPGQYKVKCTFPGSGHDVWYKTGSNIYPYGTDAASFGDATVISTGTGTPVMPFLFHFTPRAADVSARIQFSDGTAIQNASVYAREIGSTSTEAYAQSMGEGIFCFGNGGGDCEGSFASGLRPGQYQFCIQGSWYTGDEYCDPVVRTVDWYQQFSGLTITLPDDFGEPFSAQGRVVYDDGAGVPGAQVSFTQVDGSRVIDVTTDSDGYYRATRADGLLAGEYRICAQGDFGEQCLESPWRTDYTRFLWWCQVNQIDDIVVQQTVHNNAYQ